MGATIKYSLARVGLFLGVALVLLPFGLPPLLMLMIALLSSMALSYFLLKKWRNEMAEAIAANAERRRTQKEQLQAALAGEDQS